MLSPPNIPSDWKSAGAWRRWEAPLDILEPESLAQEPLLDIAGPPRPQGHLIAVAATLRRESFRTNGSASIRVEIGGRPVGNIAAELCRHLAAALEEAGSSSCTVAGVIRGGATGSSSLRLYLWPGRRVSRGPALWIEDVTAYQAPWPPADQEGR